MDPFIQYVKPGSTYQFFAALKGYLDRGDSYGKAATKLRHFFTTIAGEPNGAQLEVYCANMVGAHLAPQSFMTYWATRRASVERLPLRASGALNLAEHEVAPSPTVEAERFPQAAEVLEEMETPTAVPIGETEVVKGWALTITDGSAYVEDEELGRKLGYSDALTVRQIIRRNFNESALLSESRRSGGRPAKVYYLTRAQSLKVIMRCDTAIADKIQDEIIAVYQAWLDRGRQPASLATHTDPAILATLQAIQGFVAEQREANALLRSVQAATTTRLDARIDTVANDVAQLRSLVSIKPAVSEQAPKGIWLKRAKAASMLGLPVEGAGEQLPRYIAEGLGLIGDDTMVYESHYKYGATDCATLRYSPVAILAMRDAANLAIAELRRHGWKVDHDGRLTMFRRNGNRTLTYVIRCARVAAAGAFDAGEAVAAE